MTDVRLLFTTRTIRLFAYGFLSVVLALYLAHAMLWRARGELGPPGAGSPRPGLAGRVEAVMPWLLVVLIAALIAWGLAFALRAMQAPPNW